jgi:hypothetical protein
VICDLFLLENHIETSQRVEGVARFHWLCILENAREVILPMQQIDAESEWEISILKAKQVSGPSLCNSERTQLLTVEPVLPHAIVNTSHRMVALAWMYYYYYCWWGGTESLGI